MSIIRLQLGANDEMVNEQFINLLRRTPKLSAKYFDISADNPKHSLSILSCFEPGTLRNIIIQAPIQRNDEINNKIVKTEKFKQATDIYILRFAAINPVFLNKFYHFEYFTAKFSSISIENLIRLLNGLSTSANFQNCYLVSQQQLNIAEIVEALGADKMDNESIITRFDIPNSQFYLLIDIRQGTAVNRTVIIIYKRLVM